HTLADRPVAFEKGAPDVVIDLCSHVRVNDGVEPLTPEYRQRILTINEELASNALRTLGFASREMPTTNVDQDEFDPEDVEHDLIWEGLIGMIDPPRAEARDSVATAQNA